MTSAKRGAAPADYVGLLYALSGDIDQLGANNHVSRLTLTPADYNVIPPVAAVMENDGDFRARIAAFEGLSLAGPSGTYDYYAKSADGRVADASVISPSPAAVTVLALEGSGAVADDLLAIVNAALNDKDMRPVADRVSVQSAEIMNYESATLIMASIIWRVCSECDSAGMSCVTLAMRNSFST